MKNINFNIAIVGILAITLFGTVLTGCDLGTPDDFGMNKKNERVGQLKILTIIFTNETYEFIPVYDAGKSWTVKGKKIKGRTPSAIAKELYGNSVKEARWVSDAK